MSSTTTSPDKAEIPQVSEPEEVEKVEAVEPVEKLPFDPNVINIPFSKDELASIVNLMGISARTFEALALAAADQGDNSKFLTLSARYQMMMTFGLKLQQVLQIGEPVSTSLH